MKRVLFCAILIAFFILMRPTTASITPDKPASPWQTLGKDSKILRLWEAGIGPAYPQVAIMQLSDALHAELERDPLSFYDKYSVFRPSKSDHDQGHAVFRLYPDQSAAKDPAIAVAVHDTSTYSGFASFQVGSVTQLDAKASGQPSAPSPGSGGRP